MSFDDDLAALARLGKSPDEVDRLANSGMPVGALATFLDLEPDARNLILRLLDRGSDADFVELEHHPAGAALAQWLLTLPAYVNAPDDDEDDQ